MNYSITGVTRSVCIRSRVLLLLLCLLTLSHAPLASAASGTEGRPGNKVTILFFWGEGCPHCAAAKPFLERLAEKYPEIEIKSYEVLNNEKNLRFLEETAKARGAVVKGVPVIFVGNRVFEGFDENVAKEMEEAVRRTLYPEGGDSGGMKGRRGKADDIHVTVPLFGKADARSLSLPVFTIVIAGIDSFNPCAFFVLFTLLSLLVHAHSRKRMLLIGGVFVLASGLIYFLFMAAWLNLFFLVGHLAAVTCMAGVAAAVISLINLKDFFFFRKGVSLTIPESSKPKLFERMRGLLHTDSFPAVLAGSIVLAVAANGYELLCTAGFPMVYTRVLTLNALPTAGYYAYLAIYNIIYMVPLAAVVVFFVLTLGSRKLSERQGRVLKLVSGLMMLGLALSLLFDPSILQNPFLAALLLLSALVAAAIIVLISKGLQRF